MSTTTRTPVELPAGIDYVLDAGIDPLDDLSVTELDIASRQLKCDVYQAVAGEGGLRWAALARLAWLWAKRTDPHAKLQPYLDLTGAQLTECLRLNDRVDQGEDDPNTNPTDAAPEH